MAVSLSLAITQNSQNVDNNTSNVTVTATVSWSYGSWNATGQCYGSITIDGTKYSFSGLSFNKNATTSGSQTIMTKTVNVSHNNDGSKTLSCSASFYTGVSAGTVTDTASKTLTTIPRATTPTLSASSADMGTSVTISLPRAASSLTHNLAYKFGSESSYTNIATGVGTSRSWTVPDKATSIPNATSGQFTIRVQTVSSGKVIGTKYAYLTGKVPASVVPTVSAVSHTEATSGLAAKFGAYVQNKSKLTVSVAATGIKGSTISEYQTTIQGKTYTAQNFTSDVLTGSGTLTIKSRAKDSRGRWSDWKSINIAVLAYAIPKIQALEAYRCNASGVAQDDGTYIAVRYQYSVTSLNSKNTAAMTVKYKQSAVTSYTSLLTGTALSANTTAKPTTPTFSTDYQFDIQMTVKDWFDTETVATTVLPSGTVIMDIKADGRGIAFGKTSEQQGIEFGWDIVDQVKSFGSLSGQYRTHDGLLLQWGNVNITPTAANEPTTAVIKFPLAYASTPITLASPISSVPQAVSVSTQRAADIVTDNTKAMAVTLTRTGTSATGIVWLAIGKGVET